eukprot:COSAG02_NODE_1368_length_13029_cov_83.912142_4_plen_31_part_00
MGMDMAMGAYIAAGGGAGGGAGEWLVGVVA